MLRVDLLAVGPLRGCDPENVAEPVVADIPALREAGDDVPARVEPNQALSNILEQDLVLQRQRAECRIAKLRIAADHDRLDLAVRLLAACRGGQRQDGDQQQGQQAPHRRRFSRNIPFSKHLDIPGQLF